MAFGISDKIKKLFGMTEDLEQEQYNPDWANVDSSTVAETFQERQDRLAALGKEEAAKAPKTPNEGNSDKTFVLGGNKPGAGGAGGSGRVRS